MSERNERTKSKDVPKLSDTEYIDGNGIVRDGYAKWCGDLNR